MSEINPYSNDKEYPTFDILESEIKEKINIENFKPNDPSEMLQSDLENSYINEIHQESSNIRNILNEKSTDQPLAYEKNNDNTCSFNWDSSKDLEENAPNVLDEIPESLEENAPNVLDETPEPLEENAPNVLDEDNFLLQNIPEPLDKNNYYQDFVEETKNVPETIEDNDSCKHEYHEVPSAIDNEESGNEISTNEIPTNEDNNTDTDSEFSEDAIEKPKKLCPFRLSIIVLLLIFIVVMCYYD